MTTSGAATFAPAISDMIIECYSRLQIRGVALTAEHIIEARRSSNLIFSEWSGARSGPPLWAVDVIGLPLVPGVSSYQLPSDTVLLLDVYRRSVTAASEPTPPGFLVADDGVTILTDDSGIPILLTPDYGRGGYLGNILNPMLDGNGSPMLRGDYEPILSSPASGTLSSMAGSQEIMMNWPNHDQIVGNPIFFTDLVSIGGVVLSGFYVVKSIIDTDTLTFLATAPAVTTSTGQGMTPLLQTFSKSTQVTVTLANHGLAIGDTYNVPITTIVGGLTLSGSYTVNATLSRGQFTFLAPSAATSSTAFFSNNGMIVVSSQDPDTDYNDIILSPISRTDYASLPDKLSVGTPTVFWLDRTIVPTVTVWQVPSAVSQYALIAYRWRALQDADPVSGQTPDLPGRWLGAFAAELTARLAEKFRPEFWKDKIALAEATWRNAEQGDFENVPLFISPGLWSYYR